MVENSKWCGEISGCPASAEDQAWCCPAEGETGLQWITPALYRLPAIITAPFSGIMLTAVCLVLTVFVFMEPLFGLEMAAALRRKGGDAGTFMSCNSISFTIRCQSYCIQTTN